MKKRPRLARFKNKRRETKTFENEGLDKKERNNHCKKQTKTDKTLPIAARKQEIIISFWQ